MNKEKLNQLSGFFNSEYFTPEMALHNLFKYRDEPAALELLCSRMELWSENEITLYSPQLCYMIIKQERSPLEKFFLLKCGRSMSLFFNLYWAISAYAKVEKNKKKLDRCETFLRCMEMAMVNGEQLSDELLNDPQQEIQTVLLRKYEEKQHRSSYFHVAQRFIGTLIKASLVLKQFPKDDRKHHLKLFVQKANQNLQVMLKKGMKGITLPMLEIEDTMPTSNTIVNILSKHQVCFHTKKRVPFLILVETIDPQELEQYQVVPMPTSANVDVHEFIEQNLNDVKFEKEMAQIESEEYRLYHEALEKIMKMEKSNRRQSQIMKTIDNIVKKQKFIEESNHIQVEVEQVNMTQIRKQSEQIQDDVNPTKERAHSCEKNDSKSKQFTDEMPKFLPMNKLYLMSKFQKKLLWEQTWEERIAGYRKVSSFAHFPSHRIRAIIVKGGDDLRQEKFALQMMVCFNKVFNNSDLKLYLRPYNIIVTSANSGIVEYVPNTMSIDALKKKFGDGTKTLMQIYKEIFAYGFEEAQKNFIESLASYSLFTYLMQVKDRHNGNILIDDKGHIVHIDFGFILQCSPGGMNFESAPFKLTQEYVELMKGRDSDFFGYFRTLLIKGLLELKKYANEFMCLLQIMVDGSELPCFQNLDLKLWMSRFMQNSTDKECMEYVDKLIYNSLYSWRTAQYDNFQKKTNGIIP